MSFELLGRLQKEFAITSHGIYETVVAISERVNRKVQIMRLHWQASTLLGRIDDVNNTLGQQILASISQRSTGLGAEATDLTALDNIVSRAQQRVQDLKRALVGIDTEIRQLKLETIHDELLRLQHDLSVRSAGIERVSIPRGAAAVGQKISDVPRSSSTHIATVLRGPFLLVPVDDLVLRTGDIVIVLGERMELDHLTRWLTSHRHTKSMVSQSA